VPIITLIGYFASSLVFATFWMRAPLRLRQVAIASNIVFFTYGVLAHAVPVAVLHLVLFPLNIWRLIELERLNARVRAALATDLSLDWLQQFMARRRFPAGQFMFRQHDAGTDAYYILDGTVRLSEIDVVVSRGNLLGEMALFSATRKRAMSAFCETDVEVLVMSSDAFAKLYYQNPEFGFYLVRLITQRLEQDVETLKELMTRRSTETHIRHEPQ
jgi:CRP/FNR family cyclic AMP-dependent transcriptional regulator